MKLVVIMFALAIFGLAVAQEPLRCFTPLRWHAHVFQASPTNKFYRIYYDGNEQKIAIKEDAEVGETREYHEDYAFFKERIGYRYNLQTGRCYNYSINGTYHRFAVSGEAKFVDRLVIGSDAAPGASVEVNVWAETTDDGGHVISMWTVHCIIVNYRYFSQRTGLVVTNFFDFELGYNPVDFVPPEACR